MSSPVHISTVLSSMFDRGDLPLHVVRVKDGLHLSWDDSARGYMPQDKSAVFLAFLIRHGLKGGSFMEVKDGIPLKA